MHRGRHSRERMKQPRRSLGAKLTIYRMPDYVHVFDKIRPGMTLGSMQRVMPMIAKVEDDDFVAIAKRSPKWKVAIDREPVAMTEHQPRRARETMLADVDNRAVVHLHVECVTSAGHMMYRRSFVHLVLTASLPDLYR